MDKNIIFYDGTCGLCHGWIKFLFARDKEKRFYVSPLDGEEIEKHLSEEVRSSLPDSIVALSRNKDLFIKSEAILYIFEQLGGFFLALSIFGSVFPQGFLDWLYDGVASIRYSIFGKKDEACPILSDENRRRFLP